MHSKTQQNVKCVAKRKMRSKTLCFFDVELWKLNDIEDKSVDL